MRRELLLGILVTVFSVSGYATSDPNTLCRAVQMRDLNAVKAAVNAGGIDLNAEAPCAPPLMIAAEGGELEIAKFLISKGAKLVVIGEYKVHDALVAAARGEAYRRKKRELGKAYKEKDKDKRRDNSEMIELLISKGAEVNPAPRFSKKGQENRRHIDEKNKRINQSVTKLTDADDRDETPLLVAAQSDRLYNVKTLLARGADPKVRVVGVTPLIAAARDLKVDIVKALLAAGAPRDQPGVGGKTALEQVQKKHASGTREKAAKDEIIRLLSR